MAPRRQAPGHTVRIGAETYARAILAAGELGQHVGDFAERAIRDALAIHDRQRAHEQRRDAWRAENGTSIPKPMQQARPSVQGMPPRR